MKNAAVFVISYLSFVTFIPILMLSSINFAQQLTDHFKDAISVPIEFRGETTVVVRDSSCLVDIMRYVKSDLEFEMLLDISSVDHMGSEPRFELVYHLYSFSSHQYLRVKTSVDEEKPELPTISNIWRAADWHEREIFDMMGIRFTGHPDLRRILMWESYPYYPLRKEFPLAGLPTGDGVVKPAPMAGGPFVTTPGEKITVDREPRAKVENDFVV